VGPWINTELPPAYGVDPQGEERQALVEDTTVRYRHVGQSARCIPDDAERSSLAAQGVEIRDIDERRFTLPDLLSISGGDGPVREEAKRRLKPDTSVYRVTRHRVESPPRWNQAVRGTVLVKGPRSSFAQRVWEQSARIFIRESGA